ncbi:MAG TPA: PorV/PorQ family protein [Candidatus Cloacimonadota bacterium]|nr:PorV/PorQ family protein [Candidatus Cloacimonadota bacterium]HPS39250.1 PorV/PorQ family protein [Candidatus Cloacimonadota bacterium]
MNNKLLFIVGALLLVNACFADYIHDNAGEYGFKFLNIPVNPVSLALAGRPADPVENSASFIIQPAISTLEKSRSVGASQSKWISDTNNTNLYYSYSNRRSHFGLAMRNLSYGEIEKRDEYGNIIGYYNPMDLNVCANYGLRLTPSQYIGINAGVVYEKISTASALGFSTDLGYTWLPPFPDMIVSLAVRNLGYGGKMNDETLKLPLAAELDISKTYTRDNTSVRLAVSATQSLDEQLKGTFGTELGFWNTLYLRAGYKINYSAEDLTAGIGIRYDHFGVDYGWASFTDNLSDVHSLGLSYYF